MTGDMLKSGVCSEKQSTIQLEKHLQLNVSLNQTVSLMCVCGGGGGQLLVCANCAFSSLATRERIQAH